MKNEKIDAIQFKRQLQENAWKRSKPKNSKEFMEGINKNAEKSVLYRKNRGYYSNS